MGNPSMSNLADGSRDAFALLGLAPVMSLAPQALEDAFRKAQLSHHPDRAPEDVRDEAETRFAQVVEAYETLKDIKTRATLLFKNLGLWPAPHNRAVLEELLDLEEAWQAGALKRSDLIVMLDNAHAALCRHFDGGRVQDAGTAFMRLNALRRMASSEPSTVSDR